jgi:hypothetical protein
MKNTYLVRLNSTSPTSPPTDAEAPEQWTIFVVGGSPEDAGQSASHYIRDRGWVPRDPPEVEKAGPREEYFGQPELLAVFDVAQVGGIAGKLKSRQG